MTCRARMLVFMGLIFLAVPWSVRAEDGGRLAVCLEENSDPYSWKRGKNTGGFDLSVAQAVADGLGTKLAVQWFETENEEESFPDREANALMSAGVCDLVGGYPLYGGALGAPSSPTATLPDHEGANSSERLKRYQLGELVPSRPYHNAPLQVIVGPEGRGRRIETLSDLNGLRLGAEEGTLTDTIFMAYRGGYFASKVTHIVPKSGILAQLEAGAFDAVLIELHRFDAYRRDRPDTQLRAASYRHALGFNMGFVGLKSRQDLLDRVNRTLEDLVTSGKLDGFATAAGMTLVPPTAPAVLDRISMGLLFGG